MSTHFEKSETFGESFQGRFAWCRRMLIVAAIVAGVTLFIGANVHLLYVAISTNPECVAHTKTPGSNVGQFQAAKSSC